MTAQRAASILEVPVADAAGMSAALEADGYLESRPSPVGEPETDQPETGVEHHPARRRPDDGPAATGKPALVIQIRGTIELMI